LCLKQPFLVISLQTDHLGIRLRSKRENGFNATSGIRPSVDVIAEKDHDISSTHFGRQLPEEIPEGGAISVNVADCYRRHNLEAGAA
jgi:hypothetical protein